MPTGKLPYIFIILLLAFGALSYRVYPSQAALHEAAPKQYVSGQYGISLSYPDSYRLVEERVGPSEPPHDRLDFSSADASDAPDISIDIIENKDRYATAADFQAVLGDFLRANGYLGRAVSTVIVRRGYVYVFSTTHTRADDPVAGDLTAIVQSVRLSE